MSCSGGVEEVVRNMNHIEVAPKILVGRVVILPWAVRGVTLLSHAFCAKCQLVYAPVHNAIDCEICVLDDGSRCQQIALLVTILYIHLYSNKGISLSKPKSPSSH